MPDTIDLDLPAIATRYSEMTDAALMDEARGYDSLRSEVQPLLREEFARRGLEPPLIEEDVPELRHLVTVGRYRDLPEASLAQGALESAGIESFLRDINLVRNDWFYSNMIGGVRLDVAESDLDTARSILAEPIPATITLDDGEVYRQPECPHCHSLNIQFEEVDQDIKLTALALLTIPVPGFTVNRWKCAACGAEWQDDGETGDGMSATPVG